MSYQTSDPYEFLHFCNSQDQVITDQNKLFISNLVIYDVPYQINHHQTVLQLFNEQNVLQKTLWGLQDIQLPNSDNIDQAIKNALESTIIYSQTLPGGQLFKISYQQEINAWLIYSNNATIVAEVSDDLSEFSFQRFDAAVEIGELWFNFLNDLNENQIQNLKKDLNNRTLYGQILNQQSLVYVPVDTLYFLGIKDLDFETTMQFFTFYGLNHPKVAQFQPQQKILQKHIERINRSDIELEMAGVILHFGNNSVLINTLEYLILKQIQGILLNESHIEKDLKQYIKTFSHKPVRPLKFYQNILDEALKIAHQYTQVENIVRNKFNDFVTIILFNLFNNKNFNWSQIKNVNDYRKLWSTYQPEQLQRIPVYLGEQPKNPENVFLIIPVSINGIGISTFARTFQTYYLQTQIITDYHDAKIKDNQVIFIDHNHTPEEAKQVINQSSKFCKKIILYVQTTGSKNELKVPFSIQLILTALKRSCTSIEKIQLFLKKLKAFENFNYDQIQGDGFIEFPFIDENFQIDHQYIEEDLIDAFFNESKKNLNSLWKSLKEFQLNKFQQNNNFDDEIKNIIHNLYPKVAKIEKHTPIQTDDIIRKNSEDAPSQKPFKPKKEKQHQLYNPTYLPNTLSFQIMGGYSVKDKINKWIYENLTTSSTQFKNDADFEKIITLFKKQSFENGEQYFISEKDWKLDLINIPQGDQSVRQLPYFKDFIPDKEGEIFIKTLFISLDGLIAGLANQSVLPCQSPFPHVNFYFKNIKSKDSLDVISQTILQNQQLKAAYKDGSLQKSNNNSLFVKEEIRYRGKIYKIYIISLKDGITVNALSTDRL